MKILERVLRNAKGLVLAAPVLGIGAGCYEYRPASTSALQAGQTVHVVLTNAGAAALAPTVGANAAALDGRILSTSADMLRIAVTQVARTKGPEEFMPNEPITLDRSAADAVTVRGFDPARTVLAAAGLVAAVIAGNALANQSGVFSTKTGVSGATR